MFSDEFADLFLAYWFGQGRFGVSDEGGVLVDRLGWNLAIRRASSSLLKVEGEIADGLLSKECLVVRILAQRGQSGQTEPTVKPERLG